jgi:glycosyltransferase involved in cell wall biosynthesis
MIGFVSTMHGCPWGGSEELWARTAVRLKEGGQKVMVSMCDWPDTARPVYFRNLVNNGTLYLRRKELFPNKMDRLRGKMKEWAGLNDEVTRWIEKHSPTLMVFSAGDNHHKHAWSSACARLGVPYALITQGVQEAFWPTDEFAGRMGDDFEHAARCFFVSQANLDTTRFQTCCSGSNFEVVRNPFAVPYDVNLEWPDESNGLRMAFVGRLEPGSKGCDLLLRAFASPVWRERPVSLHLYGDGPSQNGVRRLADLLKSEQVFFHGRVDNVEKIWRENHMLVLSSRFEGLPLAVVEAMLCGRPCLVTDISGNAELL